MNIEIHIQFRTVEDSRGKRFSSPRLRIYSRIEHVNRPTSRHILTDRFFCINGKNVAAYLNWRPISSGSIAAENAMP